MWGREHEQHRNPNETLPEIDSRIRVSFDTTLGVARFLFANVDPETEDRFLGAGGMSFVDPNSNTESFEIRYGFNATFDKRQTGRLVAVTIFDFFRQKAFLRALEALDIPVVEVESTHEESLFEEPVEPQPDPVQKLLGEKLVEELLRFDEEDLPALMRPVQGAVMDNLLLSDNKEPLPELLAQDSDVRFEIQMPQLTPEETLDLQLQRRAMHEELRLLQPNGPVWIKKLEDKRRERRKLPPEEV